VQNNKLVTLPPEIQQLTSLTALSISGNNMTFLPPELSALSHLKDLHVESPVLKSPSPTIAAKGAKAILEYLRTVAKAISTKTLDLSGIGLEAFPPDVGILSNLTRLKVSDNNMQALSDDIKGMVSLTHLDARHNRIANISTEIGKLTALTELLLDKNQLGELPASLAYCSRLCQLTLENNPLNSPPPKIIAKGILRILEYQRRYQVAAAKDDLLDLSDLDLDELPVEAAKMASIKTLSLRGNNLEKLTIKGADMLPLMTNLTSLNISANPWGEALPENVQHIETIATLLIENVGLKSIPAWLGSMGMLKHLSVRGNKLNKLPNEIGKMLSLATLDVGCNQMKEVPKVVCTHAALRHLIFDGNLIATLAPEIEKLKGSLLTLNVAKNLISALPDFIYSFDKLQVLDVSGNRLADIKPAIGQMTTLKSLLLAENVLEHFPIEIGLLKNLTDFSWRGNRCLTPVEVLDGRFAQATDSPNVVGASKTVDYFGRCLAAQETHTLNLDHLDLCTFPHDVVTFSALTELSVYDNMVQIVPASIQGMVSLRVLALHSNRIDALPGSIGKLTNLEILNLASNLLQMLPAEVGLCQKLKELSLQDNPLMGPLQDLVNRGTPDVLAYLNMLLEARKTKELNLSFQGFRFFPVEAMYIDDLKTLFVNDNQIRAIPEAIGPLMTSLTELNLGNNEIASLPYTVGELTALTKMTLSGNVLKNLTGCPPPAAMSTGKDPGARHQGRARLHAACGSLQDAARAFPGESCAR